MERKMRRATRELPLDEAKELFAVGNHGVLSINGDDGYPYGVPVGYLYMDDAIYIHSAKQGHKVEALTANNKVCFTAILKHEVVGKQISRLFESVIVIGNAVFVSDPVERKKYLERYAEVHMPNDSERARVRIQFDFNNTLVIRIDIKEMRGKANRGQGWTDAGWNPPAGWSPATGSIIP